MNDSKKVGEKNDFEKGGGGFLPKYIPLNQYELKCRQSDQNIVD